MWRRTNAKKIENEDSYESIDRTNLFDRGWLISIKWLHLGPAINQHCVRRNPNQSVLWKVPSEHSIIGLVNREMLFW